MSFITDKQTLDDLNVLGKFKNNSLFRIFNQVKTQAGERLLENMFRNPLSEIDEINQRSKVFSFFQSKDCIFPCVVACVEEVANYLGMQSSGGVMTCFLGGLRKSFLKTMGLAKEYELVYNGIIRAGELLQDLNQFLEDNYQENSPFENDFNFIRSVLNDSRLAWFKVSSEKKLSFIELIKRDYSLRYFCASKMKRIVELISEIDVNITVSKVASENGFTYARVLPAISNIIDIKDVWHPTIKNGVPNSILLSEEKNVLFLTGANMAGKSTFMKSFGSAIYLSHMGFPVAARQMQISIRDGIYTSINVPDNLSMGYSHFYAEVLRVKKVAEEVSRGKNLVVIFDELFKGTNVKDAFDATVEVTKAFSEVKNCTYIISTHIIEAAEPLGQFENFQFVYLPTIMEGTKPIYTYKLKNGVTADRHGKIIIDNERIVETILENIEEEKVY